MPVYTAQSVSGQQKPTPALERRGILLKAVTPTRLNAIGYPDYRQLAYSTYVTCMAAFLKAAVDKVEVSTVHAFFQITLKASDHVPISYPPSVFAFAHSLTSEEEEKITKLGARVVDRGKAGRVYTTPEGTMNEKMLKELTSHPKGVQANTMTFPGQANLSGISAFLTARTLITAFLRTQYYPAFTGPVADPPPPSAFENMEGFSSMKRKSNEEKIRKNMSKRNRLEEPQEDEEGEMDTEEDMSEEVFETIQFTDVPRARPPQREEKGFGEYSDAPQETGGLLFPYFTELLEDDAFFVRSVVQQYFIACFGSTAAENTYNLRKFTNAIGYFAQSECGRILNHIFLGIKLAIETQTRLFLFVRDQRYTGFALFGYYYTVFIGDVEYRPLIASELIQEVKRVDEHQATIAQILLVVAKAKGNRPGRAAVRKAGEFKRARDLRRYILSLNYLKDTDIEEIDKLSNLLTFKQTYTRFTQENIQMAIEMLVEGVEPSDDYAMFCAGGILTTQQLELSIFAQFGNLGFSFLCPGGVAKHLPSKLEDDILYKEYRNQKGRMVEPRHTLVLCKKELRVCREDWIRFLKDRNWVSRDQRASAFKSIAFNPVDSKKMWRFLIESVPEYGNDTEEQVNADVVVDGKKVRETETTLDFSDFL